MRVTIGHRIGRIAAPMTWILVTALAAGVAQAGSIDPDRSTVLITGSNRGIGLAFAQHYVAAGWNVLATTRTPERATELLAMADAYEHLLIEQLDVTDNERIAGLAASYRGTTIDVLINNAGVLGDLEKQSWGSLDSATFEQVLAVNVFRAAENGRGVFRSRCGQRAEEDCVDHERRRFGISRSASGWRPDLRCEQGGAEYGHA